MGCLNKSEIMVFGPNLEEKERELKFELTRFRNAELRHFVPCLTLTLTLFQYPQQTKVATFLR
jgi:hypothetical protein